MEFKIRVNGDKLKKQKWEFKILIIRCCLQERFNYWIAVTKYKLYTSRRVLTALFPRLEEIMRTPVADLELFQHRFKKVSN